MNANSRNERDWQRALFVPLTILAWMAVIVIVLWLLGHIVKTVLTLILSAVVAFALTPLVSFFARWMPRVLAIALAYLLGFAFVLGLLGLVIATAAAQVTTLVEHLPAYANDVQRMQPQIVRILSPFGVTNAKFQHAQDQLLKYLQSAGTQAADQSVTIITGIIGTLVDVVLILILRVYLTANSDKIATRLRREAPMSQRFHLNLLIAIVNQVVGGYVRGQITLSALIGVLVGGGLLALHVPYAVLLGVLAFFMEFVPVIGVLVSGAVSVLIALTQGWVLAVIVLAYFVVVHVIEGDVVGPRIMGNAVGIHPATALVALVAGTELFGIWGALFGAPLAGLMQAIGTALYREWRGGDPTAVLNTVTRDLEKSAPPAEPAIQKAHEEAVRETEKQIRAEADGKAPDQVGQEAAAETEHEVKAPS